MATVLLPDFVYCTPTYTDDGRLVTIPCNRHEHTLCSGSYRAGATFRATCWCLCHHTGSTDLEGEATA